MQNTPYDMILALPGGARDPGAAQPQARERPAALPALRGLGRGADAFVIMVVFNLLRLHPNGFTP